MTSHYVDPWTKSCSSSSTQYVFSSVFVFEQWAETLDRVSLGQNIPRYPKISTGKQKQDIQCGETSNIYSGFHPSTRLKECMHLAHIFFGGVEQIYKCKRSIILLLSQSSLVVYINYVWLFYFLLWLPYIELLSWNAICWFTISHLMFLYTTHKLHIDSPSKAMDCSWIK